MINSKKEYVEYLRFDNSGKLFSFRQLIENIMFPVNINHFKRLLRKLEYYRNVKKGTHNKIIYYIIKYRFKKISIKLGYSIPENVFGPGLNIPHYGNIIINAKTRIGKNCKIHVGTNIGESGGEPGAPIIGDNVYIGPGVKIYGNIIIANNIAIAANAAVNRSFLNENKLIGGVPAKEIGNINVNRIIKKLNL